MVSHLQLIKEWRKPYVRSRALHAVGDVTAAGDNDLAPTLNDNGEVSPLKSYVVVDTCLTPV